MAHVHPHHGHGGHDHHGPARHDSAFALGIALNLGFVAVEAGFGFATGSVALLADAGHNLSDVLGLAIAWAGAALTRRDAGKRFTYGLRGSSILAALANAALLLVAVGAIALEAIRRLSEPPTVPGATVAIVAALGIVVNGGTALLFLRGRESDINLRGAYLHMVADAAVSAGVVVGGLLMLWSGAGWIDPLISLVIAALILWQTWGLLVESTEMALAAVPRGIDIDEVAAALAALPGVERVHDLHVWPMSTTETGLTAHLRMPGGGGGDAFLAQVARMLHDRFAIGHVTVQLETGDCGAGC